MIIIFIKSKKFFEYETDIAFIKKGIVYCIFVFILDIYVYCIMCILYIFHNSILLYFDNLCKYISLSDHCQLLKSFSQLYQVKNR